MREHTYRCNGIVVSVENGEKIQVFNAVGDFCQPVGSDKQLREIVLAPPRVVVAREISDLR